MGHPAVTVIDAPAGGEDGLADQRASDALEQQRAATVGYLGGDFMHEVRNALAGIRCFLELVSDAELPPMIIPLASEVDDVIERTAAVAGGFHEIVRSRGSSKCLNVELDRLLTLLDGLGPLKTSRVERDLDPAVNLVAASADALHAALLVLLAELADHRPQRITVRTRLDGDRAELRLEAFEPTRPGARRADLEIIGRQLEAPVLRDAPPALGFVLVLAVSEARVAVPQ